MAEQASLRRRWRLAGGFTERSDGMFMDKMMVHDLKSLSSERHGIAVELRDFMN
ncbi:MAG: hypothetical protein P4L66_09380 [Acetobacteraceae bacterium]|nr:hypothetical protein [Acetobacteraceae bacterium]